MDSAARTAAEYSEQLSAGYTWDEHLNRGCGGDALAPGPPGRPLQYIDCRDLAAWLLHAADAGICGTFNTVSKPGQATMSRLLEAAMAVTGSAARLVWVSPEVIEKTGIRPWTELPIWVPPDGELAGLHRPASQPRTRPG